MSLNLCIATTEGYLAMHYPGKKFKRYKRLRLLEGGVYQYLLVDKPIAEIFINSPETVIVKNCVFAGETMVEIGDLYPHIHHHITNCHFIVKQQLRMDEMEIGVFLAWRMPFQMLNGGTQPLAYPY